MKKWRVASGEKRKVKEYKSEKVKGERKVLNRTVQRRKSEVVTTNPRPTFRKRTWGTRQAA